VNALRKFQQFENVAIPPLRKVEPNIYIILQFGSTFSKVE
jgi:hypothetical protein